MSKKNNTLDKLYYLIEEYNRFYEKFEKIFEENKHKNDEDFVFYLKTSINSIDIEVTKASTEMQYEKMNNLEKRGINKCCKKLNTIKVKYELKLKGLGKADNSDEYEHFLDLYDYVDTKLALEHYKAKVMLDDENEPKNIKEIDTYVYDTEKGKYNNKHPSIFEDGAFCIFTKWIDVSNDELDKKISFIFQILKSEEKLRKTNFKDLSKWAYNNNFLDKENYDKLNIDGCFLSPSKILTKARKTLYNSIKDN